MDRTNKCEYSQITNFLTEQDKLAKIKDFYPEREFIHQLFKRLCSVVDELQIDDCQNTQGLDRILHHLCVLTLQGGIDLEPIIF